MPNSEGRDLRLICFPPESRFEIGVHAAVDAAVESGHGSILESVEVKLRETYPDVIVIVHEPFGAQGEDAQTHGVGQGLEGAYQGAEGVCRHFSFFRNNNSLTEIPSPCHTSNYEVS